MSEIQGTELVVDPHPIFGEYRVYLIRRAGDGVQLATEGEMGLEWNEVDPAVHWDRVEATWCIPREFASALVDKLTEHGHRSDRDAKLVGTLEATRGHLEDLRQLLGLEDEAERTMQVRRRS